MSSSFQTRANAISTPTSTFTSRRKVLLQRTCGCGGPARPSGECAECCGQRLKLRRASLSPRGGDFVHSPSPKSGEGKNPVESVPSIVHDVLRSSGQALDGETRAFFEPRFGHDFSQVRVHDDGHAAESARAVNALAYTVGRDVVFAAGQYAPDTNIGRGLIGHELTHVAQQRDAPRPSSYDELTVGAPDSMLEREAYGVGEFIFSRGISSGSASPRARVAHRISSQVISRADPATVGYALALGTVPSTGLQFWPITPRDTVVGPVTSQGGRLKSRSPLLHVIIGENLTPRTLARQLMPLFTSATPFTPTGAAAPLPLVNITEDELAQALLVYNQYYLPVPALTNWRSGLRVPLPIRIDEATGVATLHPLLIQRLAAAADPAWAPLLDRRASATTAPSAATVTADASAFLAAEPTAWGRGMHLKARSVTNAVAEFPFVREVFLQLGAGGFDVALGFMDNSVNREISLLAAQRDGAAILAEIRSALAAAPAMPTAAQTASLDRANLMLGLVAGVAAQAPPTAARTRAEKTITVDTVKLDGSNHNPVTDVALASAILGQCNVRVVHGVNATATIAQTTDWLRGDTDLHRSGTCGSTSADERRLFPEASTTFGLAARFRAFFPATLSGGGGAASGYSFPPFCATGAAAGFRNIAVIENSGDSSTLAHELGHILLNSSAHPGGTIMSGRPRPPRLTDPQCTTLHNNA